MDEDEPFSVTDELTFSLVGRTEYGFTVLTDSTTVDNSSGEVLANVILEASARSAIVSPLQPLWKKQV